MQDSQSRLNTIVACVRLFHPHVYLHIIQTYLTSSTASVINPNSAPVPATRAADVERSAKLFNEKLEKLMKRKRAEFEYSNVTVATIVPLPATAATTSTRPNKKPRLGETRPAPATKAQAKKHPGNVAKRVSRPNSAPRVSSEQNKPGGHGGPLEKAAYDRIVRILDIKVKPNKDRGGKSTRLVVYEAIEEALEDWKLREEFMRKDKRDMEMAQELLKAFIGEDGEEAEEVLEGFSD